MTNQKIICPSCKQAKPDIKQFRLFDSLLFILFAARHKSSVYRSCSVCMRKLVKEKTFNWNILTAWILWFIIILPWHSIVYLRTFGKGHSKSIINPKKGENNIKVYIIGSVIALVFILLIISRLNK